MLFIIVGVGVGIVLVAGGFITRMWVPGGVHSGQLGWMSEQWLTEYRASHFL